MPAQLSVAPAMAAVEPRTPLLPSEKLESTDVYLAHGKDATRSIADSIAATALLYHTLQQAPNRGGAHRQLLATVLHQTHRLRKGGRRVIGGSDESKTFVGVAAVAGGDVAAMVMGPIQKLRVLSPGGGTRWCSNAQYHVMSVAAMPQRGHLTVADRTTRGMLTLDVGDGGRVVSRIDCSGADTPCAVAASSDGLRLAVVETKGTFASFRCRFYGDVSAVAKVNGVGWAVAFVAPHRVAVAHHGTNMAIVDVTTGAQVHSVPGTSIASCFAFHSEGHLAVASFDQAEGVATLRIVRISDGETMGSAELPSHARACSVLENGDVLLCLSHQPGIAVVRVM